MELELKLFTNPKFGDVRTIIEDDKVLFCGNDVAKGFGYKSPKDAIAAHCKGAVKRRTLTDGGEQEMVFIAEGDVYRLAARSKLPGADEFERWIFDEVLPSLRKHGAYMTEEVIERALSDPDFIIQIATTLKEERQKRKELETEVETQRQMIADFEPIKRYVDTILESTSTMATSQIAADYDLSARQLNKILKESGIQHNVNGQWILYKKHMGNGYTKSKTFHFLHSDGSKGTRVFTQWSQKGRLLIHEILTERGILAIMDRPQAM